jgi:NADH-quinone oxidoreductase subunit F
MVVWTATTAWSTPPGNFLEFTTKESCGTCTPCREGLSQATGSGLSICEGEGKEEDLQTLKELGCISATPLCAAWASLQ